jgi:hypothetical protein
LLHAHTDERLSYEQMVRWSEEFGLTRRELIDIYEAVREAGQTCRDAFALTLLTDCGPGEYLAPDPARQLDDRLRIGLQVAPPGRLGRTPAIHGHRDLGRGGHNPMRPPLARTIRRCTRQNVLMNHRGGRRASPLMPGSSHLQVVPHDA